MYNTMYAIYNVCIIPLQLKYEIILPNNYMNIKKYTRTEI